MKPTTPLLLLSLGATALARTHDNSTTTTDTTTTSGGGGGGWRSWDDCKKLEKLREKVALGVNATTTADSEGGEKEGRRVKWAEKLAKLEANETLVAECAAKAGGGSVASGAGVASPTGSSGGSAEATGSTKPPSDSTIISGVSGALEPVGNMFGMLGVVLFGALLL
ncbi:hypothetical protein QBC39DRAFT_370703 [Podospora conica]|nr:hypothetical protein QBC39DRAFT_370703 [Schizothecium conicum]